MCSKISIELRRILLTKVNLTRLYPDVKIITKQGTFSEETVLMLNPLKGRLFSAKEIVLWKKTKKHYLP
ncbi:MAG: hypothetical protein IIX36_03790 [Clostridia bacterium]|nr:hypothetical protein [Clostridia bacterium]